MSTENSEKNSGNVQNLVPYQFKPGKSGNPGGRPKSKPITDVLIVQLEQPLPAKLRSRIPAAFFELYGANPTFGQFLAFKLIAEAANGNLKALSLLLDRVEGKTCTASAYPEDDQSLVIRVIGCDI